MITVVDCGQPSDPDNGLVSVGQTTFGSLAAYQCDTGYRLSTEFFTRSCEANGMWAGQDPNCDREFVK